jgi:hypothetical protein
VQISGRRMWWLGWVEMNLLLYRMMLSFSLISLTVLLSFRVQDVMRLKGPILIGFWTGCSLSRTVGMMGCCWITSVEVWVLRSIQTMG